MRRVQGGCQSDPTPATYAGLEVQGLKVWYRGVVPALRGIDISVPNGQVVGIVGLNGAGKTTLMRALSGFLPSERTRVTSGRVVLNGHSIANLNPVRAARQGVVLVPERDKVFSDLSVEENLRVSSGRRSDTSPGRHDPDAVVERFPLLQGRLSQPAGLLSGGERQILALACALVRRPRLLLLDEPTLGVAPKLLDTVGSAIATIVADVGAPCIVTDQSLELISSMTGKAQLMQGGLLLADGGWGDAPDRLKIAEVLLGANQSAPPRG